jgi:hypothetical protein
VIWLLAWLVKPWRDNAPFPWRLALIGLTMMIMGALVLAFSLLMGTRVSQILWGAIVGTGLFNAGGLTIAAAVAIWIGRAWSTRRRNIAARA